MNPTIFTFEKPVDGFVITPDSWHRRVIEFTYHARLATIDQLMAIAGLSSRKDFKAALRKLCAHGYLDRPEITKSIYSHSSKRPVLHALGDAGARYCRDVLGLPIPRTVQWSRKNRELKDAGKIAHMLGVAEMKLRFQTRLDEVPEYRLQTTAEVVATSPAVTLLGGQRVSFPTRFAWPLDGREYQRSTVPDWLFRIERRADQKTLLLMLEWDEDTEPYTTKNPMSKASILQKDLGYADIFERGLSKRLFGNAGFQRLFVTTGTENRVEGCINLFQEHAALAMPATHFLYTTAERFLASDFLYDPIWLDGRRDARSLLAAQ